MRTIEKTLFQYDELSDTAQEKAREWYRRASADDNFFAENVCEDAARMGDILGIDLNQTRVNLMNGSHRYEPTIYWSGFWSQGDGACFEGNYKYKPGSVAKMRAECNDKELIRIATELQQIQRKHFYALQANMRQRGHYQHSGCMQVDVQDSRDSYRDIGAAESDITQLMRDFADWIYRQLESEYEYQNSDEQVIESIRCNEYEFDEQGDRS